jgi:molybdate transport system substrate-binding protein
MGSLRVAFTAGLIVLAPAARADVLVFAAASTADALAEVNRAYSATSGARIATSFASSGMLARQIENGAPADLFISANTEWIDYLARNGRIEAGLERELLRNRLALVAPRDSAVRLDIAPGFALADALDRGFGRGHGGAVGGGRLAIADPRHVPAGRYAKAALISLGVWAEIEPRTAVGHSVRQALVLVERGEAPLGIVYATDAAASAKVRLVGVFPSDTHPPITYRAAVVDERGRPAVTAYFRYLGSRAAAEFRRHGLLVDLGLDLGLDLGVE